MTDRIKSAFKMRLKSGAAAEYERRHDEIWPELAALIKNAGVGDFSIHLDPEDGVTLFTVLWEERAGALDSIALHPVMMRWRAEMAELMEVQPDNNPRVWPLRTVFHLE